MLLSAGPSRSNPVLETAPKNALGGSAATADAFAVKIRREDGATALSNLRTAAFERVPLAANLAVVLAGGWGLKMRAEDIDARAIVRRSAAWACDGRILPVAVDPIIAVCGIELLRADSEARRVDPVGPCLDQAPSVSIEPSMASVHPFGTRGA